MKINALAKYKKEKSKNDKRTIFFKSYNAQKCGNFSKVLRTGIIFPSAFPKKFFYATEARIKANLIPANPSTKIMTSCAILLLYNCSVNKKTTSFWTSYFCSK